MVQSPAAVDVVRCQDAAWDAWLELAPHDVYHLAGYHDWSRIGAAGAAADEAFLVVVGDRSRGLAWPYLLRRVATEPGLEGSSRRDVTSTYGYPGPVAWGCRPGDSFLEAAWAQVRAVWREQGAVSAFTRFHPLLENAALLEPLSPAPGEGDGVVAIGSTISLDCTVDDRLARSGYARAVRKQVNRARRSDLVFEHDEAWTHLPAFTRIYRETMDRNEAASSYYHDEDAFRRLRDALEPHLHLVVVRSGEEVASAGLFTELGGIVQFHLVGNNPVLLPLSPQKYLVDEARRWARQRGNRVLHLGGGRGGTEDSLFTFKSRFSDRRHVFQTGRWILDPPRYLELAAAHRAAVEADGTLDEGYFPVYRAPLARPDATPVEGPEA